MVWVVGPDARCRLRNSHMARANSVADCGCSPLIVGFVVLFTCRQPTIHNSSTTPPIWCKRGGSASLIEENPTLREEVGYMRLLYIPNTVKISNSSDI